MTGGKPDLTDLKRRMGLIADETNAPPAARDLLGLAAREVGEKVAFEITPEQAAKLNEPPLDVGYAPLGTVAPTPSGLAPGFDRPVMPAHALDDDLPPVEVGPMLSGFVPRVAQDLARGVREAMAREEYDRTLKELDAGLITPDEGRRRLGLEPMPPGAVEDYLGKPTPEELTEMEEERENLEELGYWTKPRPIQFEPMPEFIPADPARVWFAEGRKAGINEAIRALIDTGRLDAVEVLLEYDKTKETT